MTEIQEVAEQIIDFFSGPVLSVEAINADTIRINYRDGNFQTLAVTPAYEVAEEVMARL